MVIGLALTGAVVVMVMVMVSVMPAMAMSPMGLGGRRDTDRTEAQQSACSCCQKPVSVQHRLFATGATV